MQSVSSQAYLALGYRLRFLRTLDARWLQIVSLCSLLTVGVVWKDFSLYGYQVVATFMTALVTQYVGMRWLKQHLQQAFTWRISDFLSAFITSFGISLLVRADNAWVHPTVAVCAIASKFLITVSRPDAPQLRAHVFNPANLAAVLAGYVLPGAWLSPGQWGQSPALALLLCALGFTVTLWAKRWDIALTFIVTYAALLALRIDLIQANPAGWLHQLSNGSLLLFTFFMISDPMTTPQHRITRIVFAAGVAGAAFTWQYTQFKPNGPVLALFAASFLVPLLNQWRVSPRFNW